MLLQIPAARLLRSNGGQNWPHLLEEGEAKLQISYSLLLQILTMAPSTGLWESIQ